MDFSSEGPMALPLWINGHAYLTVTEAFFDVRDAHSNEVLRRVPLAGQSEAAEAVVSARRAQAVWQGTSRVERQACLTRLADGLARYAGHFAKLLQQETVCDDAAAAAEVESALAALRGDSLGESGVLGIVIDPQRPLSAFLELAAPAWRAGACVIVKPSPKAPSAIFALCELTARAEWPAGVCNLMQGDVAAIEGLCDAGIDRLQYRGEPLLGAQVAGLAAARGVVCRQNEA